MAKVRIRESVDANTDHSAISNIALPTIAIVVSFTALHIDSLCRSADLAIKHSRLCKKKEEYAAGIADFDKTLNRQGELAYRFYL